MQGFYQSVETLLTVLLFIYLFITELIFSCAGVLSELYRYGTTVRDPLGHQDNP